MFNQSGFHSIALFIWLLWCLEHYTCHPKRSQYYRRELFNIHIYGKLIYPCLFDIFFTLRLIETVALYFLIVATYDDNKIRHIRQPSTSIFDIVFSNGFVYSKFSWNPSDRQSEGERENKFIRNHLESDERWWSMGKLEINEKNIWITFEAIECCSKHFCCHFCSSVTIASHRRFSVILCAMCMHIAYTWKKMMRLLDKVEWKISFYERFLGIAVNNLDIKTNILI